MIYTSTCAVLPDIHEARQNDMLHCSDLAHSYASLIFTGISYANKSSSLASMRILLTPNSSRKVTAVHQSTSSLPNHLSSMHGNIG
jgi:putative hemolysin